MTPQTVSDLECVNEACGYDWQLSPPPVVKPHCPKCGGPVKLTNKVWPDDFGAGAPVVGKPIEVTPFDLATLTDKQLHAELQRRAASQVSVTAADDNDIPLGTDSAPVDDGDPPKQSADAEEPPILL